MTSVFQQTQGRREATGEIVVVVAAAATAACRGTSIELTLELKRASRLPRKLHRPSFVALLRARFLSDRYARDASSVGTSKQAYLEIESRRSSLEDSSRAIRGGAS